MKLSDLVDSKGNLHSHSFVLEIFESARSRIEEYLRKVSKYNLVQHVYIPPIHQLISMNGKERLSTCHPYTLSAIQGRLFVPALRLSGGTCDMPTYSYDE